MKATRSNVARARTPTSSSLYCKVSFYSRAAALNRSLFDSSDLARLDLIASREHCNQNLDLLVTDSPGFFFYVFLLLTVFNYDCNFFWF